MSVRLFTPEDLKALNRWEAMCEKNITPHHGIPKIGFIVPDVCAGFLYQTDSSICLFDGFIANPEARGEKRKAGLDAVTDALIISAKDLGFKSILAFTQNERIERRCERYEFQLIGAFNLYVRGL
jgi:hypothetical protein